MLIIPAKSVCTKLHENKNKDKFLIILNRQTYCIPKYMFSGLRNSNPRSNFKSKHSDRLARSFLAVAGGSTNAFKRKYTSGISSLGIFRSQIRRVISI